MGHGDNMLGAVAIPYGAWWSTPFARWQGSFANLHAIRFAAHVAARELARRRIDPSVFDHGVLGISVWSPELPYQDALFGSAQDYSEAAYNRWGNHPDYTEAACSASGLVLQDALKRLGK